MTYAVHKSTIREIRSDDPGFYLTDGVAVAGRAGIVVHPECPDDHAFVIRQALSKKWISLTSRVYDNELVWEELNR